ncbi:MAG: Type 1 glutamine amidotransferase-like domain-containing protein [bacterium]
MTSKLQKIIAIGGGEIGQLRENGHGNYAPETTLIDREILHLTDKKKPTLLFIPTASSDSKSYYQTVEKHFLEIGFASVDALFLSDKSLTKEQIEKNILSHDAIYVGGGNTLKMMTIWRDMGIDNMLNMALKKGIVLSGLSAGSICWFYQGISDSASYEDKNEKYIKVAGLNFIDAIHSPHFSEEPQRKHAIEALTRNSSKVAICLDNAVALVIIGNKYKIIRSSSGAKAYKAYWENDEFKLNEIAPKEKFMNIDDLLVKSSNS